MNGDMPHWCATNTATSKEIWVEPVNRFLGTVSIYANHKSTSPAGKEKNVRIDVLEKRNPQGTVNVIIRLSGTGKHEINIKTFNCSADFTNKQIDLSVNNVAEIISELKITDINKPYIVLISSDKNPELQKEIVGSFY
jgi:hypothetical protein